MGHNINYYTEKVRGEKHLQAFINQITACAYDPKESSSYHGHITIHRDKTYANYDEAEKAIKSFDNGWYDDHVVKYMTLSDEGRKKIAETKAKRELYILNHSIHNRSSRYIGCPECGSRLFLSYIKGEKCPLCNTDLRPKSTIDRIKAFDKKVKDIEKSSQKEYWLAKIEYHC